MDHLTLAAGGPLRAPEPRISDLALLATPFRDRLLDLQSALAAQSIPLLVFETIRSPTRQNQLFAIGRDPGRTEYGRTVTDAAAWQSAHQFGLGTDCVFFVDGRWTWVEPEKGMWNVYSALAKEHGLVTLTSERPHVQIANFDFTKLTRGPSDTKAWLAWLGERAKAVA